MAQVNKLNQTDVYRVKRNTRVNQGVFLCKLIMKKHGTVQIQGMGQAISLVSKLAQILTKNGYANNQYIKSESVSSGEMRSINPKLKIKLNKSEQFDKLTEQIILKA